MISVIVPTYNRAHILMRTVTSILNQSFQDWELLIIDDGSEDDTASIVKCIRDKRVRYIYQSNRGVSSARNKGIFNSRGDYIAFLDSDDEWPERFLEIMHQALRSNPDFGCAYCKVVNYCRDKLVGDAYDIKKQVSGDLTSAAFRKSPFISPCASLSRRQVWDQICWDERLRTANDTDVFLRMTLHTKFLFVTDIGVKRNLTPNSLTQDSARKLSCQSFLIYERFYHHLGGRKVVSKIVAYKKISRYYRSVALEHAKQKYRTAALKLTQRAISYYPFDFRYYLDFLKYSCLPKNKDTDPRWGLPNALSKSIKNSAEN